MGFWQRKPKRMAGSHFVYGDRVLYLFSTALMTGCIWLLCISHARAEEGEIDPDVNVIYDEDAPMRYIYDMKRVILREMKGYARGADVTSMKETIKAIGDENIFHSDGRIREAPPKTIHYVYKNEDEKINIDLNLSLMSWGKSERSLDDISLWVPVIYFAMPERSYRIDQVPAASEAIRLLKLHYDVDEIVSEWKSYLRYVPKIKTCTADLASRNFTFLSKICDLINNGFILYGEMMPEGKGMVPITSLSYDPSKTQKIFFYSPEGKKTSKDTLVLIFGRYANFSMTRYVVHPACSSNLPSDALPYAVTIYNSIGPIASFSLTRDPRINDGSGDIECR